MNDLPVHPGPHRTPAQGFTLVEMLIVLLVMSILTGFVLKISRGDEDDIQVKATAYELAGVMRSARTMAMETKGMYAVAINIQNTPDSSGRVLSNGSGGHWYRVLGPRDDLAVNGWTGSAANSQRTDVKMLYDGGRRIPLYDPAVNTRNGNGAIWQLSNTTSPVPDFLAAVEKSWVGDRHVLPKNKVRFVALTDMDNGNYMLDKNTFPATYPRPWFGWWDAVSKRLYAWGGYDPEQAMTKQTQDAKNYYQHNIPKVYLSRTVSLSGFYYEGFDGLVTGCRNTLDRVIQEDVTPAEPNRDGWITSADLATPPTYTLWRTGEPRPLINGNWQDYMIIFRPDGSATMSWMNLRHQCSNAVSQAGTLMFYDPAPYNPNAATALVDRTEPANTALRNFLDLGPGDMASRGVANEATSYANRSGFHYITLGPDVSPEAHTFASAEAALRALMPLYRVGVSPYGEVTVIKVGATKPDSRNYDTALTGADWNVKAKTDAYWSDFSLVQSGTGTWRGEPISDLVTPEMLSGRKWWWQ